MIDLSGVARHLRLSLEQLRVAADLLQQGYHPAFITRYRADETGCLSPSTLWTLKFEIDRQCRLEAARQKAKEQLPKDAELDEEASTFLKRATTEVEVDAALRALRARRALAQSHEKDNQAGQLLEMLIAYDGPKIENLGAWVADQLNVAPEAGADAVHQAARLIANLMQCDTALNEKLRRSIQRQAAVSVHFCESGGEEAKAATPDKDRSGRPAKSPRNQADAAQNVSEQVASLDGFKGEISAENASARAATAVDSDAENPVGSGDIESLDNAGAEAIASLADGSSVALHSDSQALLPTEAAEAESLPAQTLDDPSTLSVGAAYANADAVRDDASVEVRSPVGEHFASADSMDPTAADPATIASETGSASDQVEATTDDADSSPPVGEADEHDQDNYGDGDDGTDAAAEVSPEGKSSKSKKNAKMTPRQRRRRWLIGMLQPMKSLKRPLTKLTAYQQLMLGRGRRSQLITTSLEYEKRSLVGPARDTFVSSKHPLADWFESVAADSLDNGLRAKLESDAVADLEELAQEKLLETAADQLRQNLLRRPIRGHTIMLVDTVGPKTAAVVVVGPFGEVLATEELPCSAQPTIVNQNVVKLGELAHRHRITLVALTNGPARRFLVLTVRELMRQSASSGLRWTMADRGGAEAYAAGRVALKELSEQNRRDRAAIWIARCLQNPLAEMLKVDVNRMRLGSYQRELPQEPLKKLVRETIADCVCSRGIDAQRAAVNELLFIPGIEEPQAQQIVQFARSGELASRVGLLDNVQEWPEHHARQAIGWLRVFGSEQSLDATAIHPDDYRLAERLIEHTDLQLPPAAPEGWVKQFVEPLPALSPDPGQSPEASPETNDGDAVEASKGTEAVSDSPEVESSPVADDPAIASSDVSDVTAGGAIAPSEGSESKAFDAVPQSAEASAEPASADEAVSGVDAAASDGLAEHTTSPDAVDLTFPKPASAREQAPRAIPEYPEDIPTEMTSPSADIDVEKLARSWQVGREKLRWLADCLKNPFEDARLRGTPIPLSSEMPTLESLTPGQCVWAVVVGVADFGAFVELSPDCSGLIHISRLSANYVEDPHQCVQVGDLLLTWVVSTDDKKNRVALTALSPAERAAAESVAQQRREERQRSGPGGQQSGQSRGGQSRSGQSSSGQTTGGGYASGGQSAGGQSRGSGAGGGQHARRDASPSGTGGSRPQGDRRGRQGGGRAPDRGRGQGGQRHAKTVVVTSKKPKALISEAMKEGEEPLRSFSDLLQFYEAKRTDEPQGKQTDQKRPANVPAESFPTEPGAEQTALEQPVAGQPAADQSAADQSAAEQSATQPTDQPSPKSESQADEQIAKSSTDQN